jgi:hypothetical protein
MTLDEGFTEANNGVFNEFELKFLSSARWHNTCSSLGNFKRLASRGGRTRTSTRFPVLGRQFKKGACTSPLFSFPVRSPTPGRSAQYSELH